MYLNLMHHVAIQSNFHLIIFFCIEHVSRTAHTFELCTIVLFVRYLLNTLFIYTVDSFIRISENYLRLQYCRFANFLLTRRVLYYPNQSDWCCYYNCSVQNQRCCGRNGWFVHLIWMVRKRPKIFTSVFVKSCIFNVHRVVLVMLVGWSWSFRGFRSFCEDSKTVECIYSSSYCK